MKAINKANIIQKKRQSSKVNIKLDFEMSISGFVNHY